MSFTVWEIIAIALTINSAIITQYFTLHSYNYQNIFNHAITLCAYFFLYLLIFLICLIIAFTQHFQTKEKSLQSNHSIFQLLVAPDCFGRIFNLGPDFHKIYTNLTTKWIYLPVPAY